MKKKFLANLNGWIKLESFSDDLGRFQCSRKRTGEKMSRLDPEIFESSYSLACFLNTLFGQRSLTLRAIPVLYCNQSITPKNLLS